MKIQKLNIIKEIDEKSFQDYEKQGFSKLDASGKLIKPESKKTTDKIAELEAALEGKDVKIAELEAALEELRKKTK